MLYSILMLMLSSSPSGYSDPANIQGPTSIGKGFWTTYWKKKLLLCMNMYNLVTDFYHIKSDLKLTE